MKEENKREDEEAVLLIPYKKKSGKVKQAEQYIQTALRNLKDKLYVYLYALNSFEFVAIKNNVNMATDGIRIFYNPDYIIKKYQSRRMNEVEVEIAHIMMHGLLGHFEEETDFRNTRLAWVIMDAQVYKILKKIGVISADDDRDVSFQGYAPYYEALLNKRLRLKWLESKALYQMDDHRFWRQPKTENQTETGKKDDEKQMQDQLPVSTKEEHKEQIKNKWKQIREVTFGMDMDTLAVEKSIYFKEEYKKGEYGHEGGGEMQTVQAASKGNSYKEILENFLVKKESCKEDLDCFDRMLYSYGLDMYKDVPLVEPGETGDDRQLNSLVIAIDTSGSCSGAIMSQFLRETYNIFQDIRESISFETIYLIQCDSVIQKVECFNSIEELEDENVADVCGFGGTSFVPVFERINKLKDEENVKVDALIYFTDGYGEYPEKEPDYPVIFAMPSDGDFDDGINEMLGIPKWIQCVDVVLEQEEFF